MMRVAGISTVASSKAESRRLLLLVSAFLYIAGTILPHPARAQIAVPPTLTRIVSDGAPSLKTGTSVTSADGMNWIITGGLTTGSGANQNLFDSFQYFDLRAGDSAVWSGGAGASSVRNVINRISGGDPSLLYGSLNSTAYSNANFFFINPAGIVFGNSFHISVPQGMYFSTASSLHFSDGQTLMARTGNGSTFSTAAPQSFGFVNNAADIVFQGAGPVNTSISSAQGAVAQFSAANIMLDGTRLTTNDSDTRLVAAGTGQLAVPVDPAAPLPALTGNLTIIGSVENMAGCICASASTPGLGSFNLYGGIITISNSMIFSDASLGSAGGLIRVQGGVVAIDHSTLSSATSTQFASGAIQIAGTSVTLLNDKMSTSTSNSGNAGAINIESTAGPLVDTDSSILSGTIGSLGSGSDPLITGAVGDIRLASAGSIDLRGTTVGTLANDYSSRTGAIDIVATGDVSLHADAATPATAVFIYAATNSLAPFVPGPVPAGIWISGRDISITGNSLRTSRVGGSPDRVAIKSTTTTDQPSGDLNITASGALAIQRADLLATAQGPLTATGAGGTLRLSGSAIVLDNTLMESSSLSGGNAGGAVIAATNTLSITNDSQLSSASSGSGNAGNVAISVGQAVTIDAGSRIDSDVGGAGASAGDLAITAPNASLTITGVGAGAPSGLITALSTSSDGSARGGAIRINVASLLLLNGAQILSDADEHATGGGGSVTVVANNVILQGAGSGIQATSLSDTTGGSISLSAGHIAVLGGASITTSAVGGSAGTINLMLPTNGILQVGDLAGSGTISTNSATKSGGQIAISDPLAIISEGGAITALGQIRSASINIDAGNFIRSSDRLNILSVDGNLVLDSQVDDVSRGTTGLKAEFIDARQVLSGRCASAATSGIVSQLAVTALGPYSNGMPSSGCTPTTGLSIITVVSLLPRSVQANSIANKPNIIKLQNKPK